jgi:RimJ/RimL family protein N-acetyltransferase
VTDTERFRIGRLVARSWQIKDPPLAIELWGDPTVTALIDSRGKLSNAQVEEELRAEIEHERLHDVQYWALFDHRKCGFVGCGGLRSWVYTPGEPNFEIGFHLAKSCWGRGLATEAPRGVLEYAWQKSRLRASVACTAGLGPRRLRRIT